MNELDGSLLKRAIAIAAEARKCGNHPFGALVADPDGTILHECGNTSGGTGDCTGHAETNVARAVSIRFSKDFLARCTLYSSAEPCAMCAGAIYWAGIGRVVYALSEADLLELTGDDPENPTLSLPCREVFARGQRPVGVDGPFDIEGAREVHSGFWNSSREP